MSNHSSDKKYELFKVDMDLIEYLYNFYKENALNLLNDDDCGEIIIFFTSP